MAFKPYTKETTIGGVKYVAQFNGLSAGIEALDDCYIDGSSNLSVSKLAKYIFENVIVQPTGLTIDDFEDMDDFNKVVQFGQKVMLGKFRNTNKSTEKTEG